MLDGSLPSAEDTVVPRLGGGAVIGCHSPTLLGEGDSLLAPRKKTIAPRK